MTELIDEVRVALIIAALVSAPYLCLSASGALENEEVVRASRAVGWIEVAGPLQKHRALATNAR